jgi:hypothetical protein
MTREELISKIIGKDPYLMKGTGFVNNSSVWLSLPGGPNWVWSMRRLESMPLKNLQVLYQDLCTKEKELGRKKKTSEDRNR